METTHYDTNLELYQLALKAAFKGKLKDERLLRKFQLQLHLGKDGFNDYKRNAVVASLEKAIEEGKIGPKTAERINNHIKAKKDFIVESYPINLGTRTTANGGVIIQSRIEVPCDESENHGNSTITFLNFNKIFTRQSDFERSQVVDPAFYANKKRLFISDFYLDGANLKDLGSDLKTATDQDPKDTYSANLFAKIRFDSLVDAGKKMYQKHCEDSPLELTDKRNKSKRIVSASNAYEYLHNYGKKAGFETMQDEVGSRYVLETCDYTKDFVGRFIERGNKKNVIDKFAEKIGLKKNKLSDLESLIGLYHQKIANTNDSSYGLCHGDFKPDQVIKNIDGVFIKDWEFAHRGLFEEDWASFLENVDASDEIKQKATAELKEQIFSDFKDSPSYQTLLNRFDNNLYKMQVHQRLVSAKRFKELAENPKIAKVDAQKQNYSQIADYYFSQALDLLHSHNENDLEQMLEQFSEKNFGLKRMAKDDAAYVKTALNPGANGVVTLRYSGINPEQLRENMKEKLITKPARNRKMLKYALGAGFALALAGYVGFGAVAGTSARESKIQELRNIAAQEVSCGKPIMAVGRLGEYEVVSDNSRWLHDMVEQSQKNKKMLYPLFNYADLFEDLDYTQSNGLYTEKVDKIVQALYDEKCDLSKSDIVDQLVGGLQKEYYELVIGEGSESINKVCSGRFHNHNKRALESLAYASMVEQSKNPLDKSEIEYHGKLILIPVKIIESNVEKDWKNYPEQPTSSFLMSRSYMVSGDIESKVKEIDSDDFRNVAEASIEFDKITNGNIADKFATFFNGANLVSHAIAKAKSDDYIQYREFLPEKGKRLTDRALFFYPEACGPRRCYDQTKGEYVNVTKKPGLVSELKQLYADKEMLDWERQYAEDVRITGKYADPEKIVKTKKFKELRREYKNLGFFNNDLAIAGCYPGAEPLVRKAIVRARYDAACDPWKYIPKTICTEICGFKNPADNWATAALPDPYNLGTPYVLAKEKK